MLLKSNSNYLLYSPHETNGALKVNCMFYLSSKVYTFVNVTYIEMRKTYIKNYRAQFVSCGWKYSYTIPKALEEESLKIQCLLRLWREGVPERQLVAVST